jgi:hypothetical protein
MSGPKRKLPDDLSVLLGDLEDPAFRVGPTIARGDEDVRSVHLKALVQFPPWTRHLDAPLRPMLAGPCPGCVPAVE